jgi:hypothetical protein
METNARSRKSTVPRRAGKALPILHESCSFKGYDAEVLMNETEKLRELITKRGTLEILIPLCCTTDPVRYLGASILFIISLSFFCSGLYVAFSNAFCNAS